MSIDRNILVLALTSCFFEGSLFLFIFFKFPALKLSHKLSGSTEGGHSSSHSGVPELTQHRSSVRPYLRSTNVFNDVWVTHVQNSLDLHESTPRTAHPHVRSSSCISMLLCTRTCARRAHHTLVFLHIRAMLRCLLPSHGVIKRQTSGRWLAS